MAKLIRKKGVTSQIFHVFIQDSTSTAGAGKTGLAYNTASLACRYITPGGTLSSAVTLEDITTLGTYAAPTSNSHMRFKEVSNADPSKGLYEIHVHNDWCNPSGDSIIIMLAGATGMAQIFLELDFGTPAVDVTKWLGTAVATPTVAGVPEVDITHFNGTAGTFSSGRPEVNTTHLAGQSVTASGGVTFPAATLASTTNITAAAGIVLSGVTHTGAVIPTVTTLTGHTPQTGDSFARIGAPAGASVSADVAAIKAETSSIQSDTNDIETRIPAALVSGKMDSSVSAIVASGLADLFDTNSGTTYASAVAGSVVKEIADNAGGSGLTEAGIADAVWDEAISGHLGAGSTGNALNAAGSAGDPWSTSLPGAYGAGTAGKIIGDNINAPIATVDAVVDAIKVKTDFLPSATAGSVGGVFIAGSNAATSITTALTANITGNLSGSVGSVTAAVSTTSNIKQNQALANFSFLMTDSTNHAPSTGKTVTCTRSIDGGSFSAGTLANVSEISNGMYRVDFGAGDLNGKNITLRATATGCDDAFERIVTQP